MRPRPSYDELLKKRIRWISIFLAAGYILLAVRLFYIQVIRAPFFQAKADTRIVKISLLAKRGVIYDRNGKKLAFSVDAYDIYVNPSRVEDKQETAEKIAPLIGWEKDRLLNLLNEREGFTYLVRRADLEMWEKVKEANIYGVGANLTTKRVYPGGSLACHIIGFTNVDGLGIEGIEKAFDHVLSGEDGYMVGEIDARRRFIPGSRRERVEPIEGKNIVLTIDSALQHHLESELRDMVELRSAVGASAVIMDPKTGEILAMANMPTYDPNNVADSDADSRRNRAITDLYEPGSTLKTLTASAGLDSGAVSTGFTINCSGNMRIGRRTVRCSLHPPYMAGHAATDVNKMLRFSCNMSAASIGLELGKEKLYKYMKDFGLYEKPGTGMVGEISGYAQKWQDWPDIQVANISFGQGIAITPLQLTRAYSAVANSGILMKSYIVKEIQNSDGEAEEYFNPTVTRRVLSEETAGTICEMLHGVVTDGTGKPAAVEGYTVAGKTGSAQKASTTGRGYLRGRFIASFVGFLPVTEPRAVILVAVDEPKGTHWGATVAAPVFQQAAREAMWRLKAPPDALPESRIPVAETQRETDQTAVSPDMGG